MKSYSEKLNKSKKEWLTRVSALFLRLWLKFQGIIALLVADCGFTIRDQLSSKEVTYHLLQMESNNSHLKKSR